MKRISIMILSAFLVLIIGAFICIPVNGLIWKLMGLEGGYDDEMKMFNILVFIEWPMLIIFGSVVGNIIFKKYLTHKSSGPKEPGR
ncbi:MAG: hypothetical protein PVH87_08555 [Desulfobacteraceae bacterium]|jgi:hypothetical protein